MKRILLSLLIPLLMILTLSSCCATTKSAVPDIYCNRPIKPFLQSLDKSKDFCTEENIKTLLTNLNQMNKYSKSLESTIKCYEDTLKKDTSKKD